MNPEEKLNNNIPENKPEEKTPIKSLRTYQGDVQDAISKNKYSSTTILVSEQKRKLENPVEVVVKKSKFRNNTFVLFGLIFILLGIFAVLGLYYIKSNEKVAVEQRTKALIGFSEERKIDVKGRDDLITKFGDNRDSWNTAVNSVLYVNLFSGNNEVRMEAMLDILAPSMMPSLKRSFSDKYMIGLYSFDTNEPFIILTVDDFSLAYSGMLKWEENMLSDLSSFFGTANNSDSRVFTDESVKNKDLRILKNSSGNILLLYSFIDRETLVIAKNRNILSAIVDKILINRQTK